MKSIACWVLLVAVTACGVASPPNEVPGAEAAPHVIWIVADDLGYADLGFTGCEDFPTPNIDALAQRGVVCTDGHVSASVCAPSRAGLITGRYAQRFGFECNLAGKGGLPKGEPTVASRLAEVGYQTAAIGKWHLGYAPHQHPRSVGFEHFTGLLGGSRSYFPVEGLRRQQRIERDGEIVPESSFDYLTDFFTEEAVTRVRERDTERPLFLYLSYTAPHGPMHAREDLMQRFGESIAKTKRRRYAAMVTALDEGVGRLTAALEDEGMLDNTLLVFLSDNGGATGNASDNGPWRGMKGSKWEGGQRVPFIVHWPAQLAPGQYDQMVSSLDLTATALAAAGATHPDELDGVPLLTFLTDPLASVPHPELFWRRSVAACIRQGSWKLVRIQEPDGSYRAPVLVNLDQDPEERVDRFASDPKVAADLLLRLQMWERGLVPPAWTEGERWQRNQRYKHQMDVLGRDAERRFP